MLPVLFYDGGGGSLDLFSTGLPCQGYLRALTPYGSGSWLGGVILARIIYRKIDRQIRINGIRRVGNVGGEKSRSVEIKRFFERGDFVRFGRPDRSNTRVSTRPKNTKLHRNAKAGSIEYTLNFCAVLMLSNTATEDRSSRGARPSDQEFYRFSERPRRPVRVENFVDFCGLHGGPPCTFFSGGVSTRSRIFTGPENLVWISCA